LDAIYHYTNWDGLYGILSDKELWFTHYQYLNDPTEIIFSMDSIKASFREWRRHLKNEKSLILWNYFLDAFEQLLGQFNMYIFSFCNRKDSMPLWRYYANNGVGFAIGFKKYFLDKDAALKNKPTYPAKVQYGNKEYSEFIKKCFEEADQVFLKTIGNDSPDPVFFKNFSDGLFVQLASYLIPSMISVKNEAFEDEKEFRLYRPEWRDFFKIPQEEKFWTQKTQPADCFANAPHPCVPRVKTAFDLSDIKEIVIGPACNILYAKNKIDELLSSIGRPGLPVVCSQWRYK
jgi:hypothetical protein